MKRAAFQRVRGGLLPGFVSGFLLLTALLTGCASVPQLPTADQHLLWQQHRQSLEQKADWTITARIAGSTEDDGWNGKLSWRQSAENYQMHFQAPFGQGALQLLGNADRVEMRTSDNQMLVADDVESLLYEQMGWRLPLKGLRYWVLGLPMPVTEPEQAEPVLSFDDLGRLTSLRQSQWQVNYEAYRRVDEIELPRKVFLENHTLSLRLVIDRWQLN